MLALSIEGIAMYRGWGLESLVPEDCVLVCLLSISGDQVPGKTNWKALLK